MLLAPGIATARTAYHKLVEPVMPDATLLSLSGMGVLAINRLTVFRTYGGSLTRAALLSARNDARANLAIVAAGFVVVAIRAAWPDLIVGPAISAMDADAAWEVLSAARVEHGATAGT
jgi:Co/Zn/Cd efflux system component